MRRFASMLGVVVVACTPAGDSDRPETFLVTLESSKVSVEADLRDTAALTVMVSNARGETPAAFVTIQVSGGATIRTPSSGEAATELTLALERGVARAELKCASAENRPVSGVMTVAATLKPNGNDVGGDVASNVAHIDCHSPVDQSVVTFLHPLDGALVHDANRVGVELEAVDYDGSPASAPTTIRIATSSTGLVLAESASDPGSRRSTLDLAPEAGRAVFYVLYPGDDATLAGPVNITFVATFVNSLGAEHEAMLSFQYGYANASGIEFILAAGSDPQDVIIDSSYPAYAVMRAGATNAFVDFTVRLRDRNGGVLPAGTPVEFTCFSSDGPDICRALVGTSPDDPDGPEQQGLFAAVTRSTIAEANQSYPRRSVAFIRYAPVVPPNPGTVEIRAAFTPPSSPRVSTGGEPAVVRVADLGEMTVQATTSPDTINAANAETAVLSLVVRNAVVPLPDRVVCAALDDVSATRARLSDGGDDLDTDAVVLATDAEGVARVVVSATGYTVRGPVTISYAVLDSSYDALLDDNIATPDQRDAPCIGAAGTQKVAGTSGLLIIRPTILGSLVFVSATPAEIGRQGSGLVTTSVVVFQLLNDLLEPVPNQQVNFFVETTGDAGSSVTPVTNTDASGNARAFVSSGTGEATLVVRAEARRGPEYVSGVSAPIPVNSGAAPLAVDASVAPSAIDATTGMRAAVTLRVRQGATWLANRLVCATLESASVAFATLDDAMDDSGGRAVVLPTSAEGEAVILVGPHDAASRGTALMTFAAFDAAYDGTFDDNIANPDVTVADCVDSVAAAHVLGVAEVQITGP